MQICKDWHCNLMTESVFTAWFFLEEYNPRVTLGIKRCFYFFFHWKCWKIDGIGDSARCCIQYMGFHVINWTLFIYECTLFFSVILQRSCFVLPRDSFPFNWEAVQERFRSGRGGLVDGWGISTDLDTITVPSPLLPHHFRPHFRCATGNRKAQLSGRRFGQSGIKCRPLFSHSVPEVVIPGDLHCAFSHTSLRGAAGIRSLQKEKCVERASEQGRGRDT